MFVLNNQAAKIKHINGREEKNVEEKNVEEKNVEEIAFDLKITVEMHNKALNMLEAGLVDAFYAIDPENAQPDMIDATENNKTMLKFPKLAPLAFNHEMSDCTIVIDYGIGGDSNIVLEECKVNDFKLVLKEGGSVAITFRVISHPTEEDIGKLYSLLKTDIKMNLEPPAPTTVQELFD
jgi:hypothetical protein